MPSGKTRGAPTGKPLEYGRGRNSEINSLHFI